MGSRRGITGFTAVRSLPLPLGLALGVGGFLVNSDGLLWLLSQSCPIAQVFNQRISEAHSPLAWIVLSICCLVALASFIRSYQRRKLADTRATLEILAASGWRRLELMLGEVFLPNAM